MQQTTDIVFENFRAVDDRFRLAGGWIDVPAQAAWLAANGVVGVLDLQFEPDGADDVPAWWVEPALILAECLAGHGIEHRLIPMFDGPNEDVEHIYEAGAEAIRDWIARSPGGKILVKCLAGRSRSVSMLAYWYCLNGVSVAAALETIRSAGGIEQLSGDLEQFLEDRFPDPALVAAPRYRTLKLR